MSFFFALLLVVFLAAYQAAFPAVENTVFRTGTGSVQTFAMPLDIATVAKTLTVELDLVLGRLHPNVLHIIPDDCLDALNINGQAVSDSGIPFCDLKGRVIDLSPYLRRGVNHIQADLRDFGGRAVFRIRAAGSDPVMFFIRAALLATLVGYGAWLLRFIGARRSAWMFFVLFVFAGILSKAYDTRFAFYQQGYDWWGHIDYVKYVAQHWAIPPAQGGWEYYQPPLYYFLAAGWWKVGEFLGRNSFLLMEDLETLSWILMVASLGASIWIGSMLFHRPQEEKERLAFVALLAFTPGIVFFSSRITNDVLFHLITLLSFAFLLRWWQRGNVVDLVTTSALLGIGLITKSNISPLILALFGALLIHRRLSPLRKTALFTVTLAIIAILAGWLLAHRFGIEGERFIVGNIDTLNGGLRVRNALANYLTFNPFQVLAIPFNSPWDDAFRRQYFWEYFFRSIFFGEFQLGKELEGLASMILLLGLLSIPLGLYGLFADLRKQWDQTFPVWMTFLLFLGAGLSYRVIAPFSCNQDFRFISPIAIPMAYFVVRGVSALPERFRSFGHILLSTYVLACVSFILFMILR